MIHMLITKCDTSEVDRSKNARVVKRENFSYDVVFRILERAFVSGRGASSSDDNVHVPVDAIGSAQLLDTIRVPVTSDSTVKGTDPSDLPENTQLREIGLIGNIEFDTTLSEYAIDRADRTDTTSEVELGKDQFEEGKQIALVGSSDHIVNRLRSLPFTPIDNPMRLLDYWAERNVISSARNGPSGQVMDETIFVYADGDTRIHIRKHTSDRHLSVSIGNGDSLTDPRVSLKLKHIADEHGFSTARVDFVREETVSSMIKESRYPNEIDSHKQTPQTNARENRESAERQDESRKRGEGKMPSREASASESEFTLDQIVICTPPL